MELKDYGIYLLIGDYIKEGNFDAIEVITKDFHVADIASIMNILENDDIIKFLGFYSYKKQAEIIVELIDEKKHFLAKHLPDLPSIVEEMESDDATDFVSLMDDEERNKILKQVHKVEAEDLRELLKYKEDCAGGIMSTEVLSVHHYSSVEEIIRKIRKVADITDQIYNVFVVSPNNILLGVLSLDNLLLAKSNIKVRDIMEEVLSVQVDISQEEVAQFVKKYDLVEVPVIDKKGMLLGRITHDDVIDVIEEEADKDLAQMAGIVNQAEQSSSIWKISKGRIIWLLIGLMGGLFSAGIISRFEQSLADLVSLAFFVPVLMAMGGIVGIQSSTITVRSLSLEKIFGHHILHKVVKEMSVTLVTAIICNIALSMLVYFWKQDTKMVQIVAISMFSIMMISAFFGTIIPLIFHRLKIDPALATGPFVTTLNDALGLSIYFTVANIYL